MRGIRTMVHTSPETNGRHIEERSSDIYFFFQINGNSAIIIHPDMLCYQLWSSYTCGFPITLLFTTVYAVNSSLNVSSTLMVSFSYICKYNLQRNTHNPDIVQYENLIKQYFCFFYNPLQVFQIYVIHYLFVKTNIVHNYIFRHFHHTEQRNSM